MVRIVCKHYDDGQGKPYSVATLHCLTKDIRGIYTMKDIRRYLSEYAPYGMRGYYYNRLKDEGHISFFTEYSRIAEHYNGENGVNNA